MDLQTVRNDADYGLKAISQKVAPRQLKEAREFVERVEQEIVR